jgi:hypothetical protein
MSAREILMFCRETSYGTPDLTTGAPTSGSAGYIRLDDGNAFSMIARPIRQPVPFGGGYNVPAFRAGTGATCTGSLRTFLYRSQASNLMNWAITRINSGRDAPWTTTDSSSVMPVGDLASMSLYHGVYDNTGTIKRLCYRGVKVQGLTLECSEQSPLVRATFDLIAKQPDPNDQFGGSDSTGPDATEFPLPADTAYPSDPYLFQHSTLKIGSSVSAYAGWTLRIQNTLDPRRFESKFLTLCRWYGRDITLNVPLYYKSTPDYRAAFEAQTAMDVELTLNDGTGSSKWDLHTNAAYTDLPFDLPLPASHMVNASLVGQYDNSNDTDLTFTYT